MSCTLWVVSWGMIAKKEVSLKLKYSIVTCLDIPRRTRNVLSAVRNQQKVNNSISFGCAVVVVFCYCCCFEKSERQKSDLNLRQLRLATTKVTDGNISAESPTTKMIASLRALWHFHKNTIQAWRCTVSAQTSRVSGLSYSRWFPYKLARSAPEKSLLLSLFLLLLLLLSHNTVLLIFSCVVSH